MGTAVTMKNRSPEAVAIWLMIAVSLVVWTVAIVTALAGARADARECRARGGFPEYADAYTVRCHMPPGGRRAVTSDLE